MTVRSGGLVEEDQAAAVLTLELGPVRAPRIVALIEERSREERRTFLVVADDETVLRRTAEAEDQRRKVGVDRFLRAIEDQLTHLLVVRRRLGIEAHSRRT